MCGICGIVRFDGRARADEPRLLAMQRSLRHRGPDGEGTTFFGACSLAHTRLVIVDAEGGAQPMTTRDGRYSLTYNGEVYNHRALREELEARHGVRFRTRSDAEVVLLAYATWGEACVHRFEGMFAFFVWDEVKEQGFAARDRLGVKPFVFSRGRGAFLFASEARAILAATDAAPRVHEASLLEYLVAPAFSGVEHAMFEGIEHLAPGHLLTVSRDGVSTRAWWSYAAAIADADPGGAAGDAARHVAEVRACLEASVDPHGGALVSDVPVGVFLSGGLDSTLLAAIARRHGRPRAFTVHFAGSHAYDYGKSAVVTSDDAPFARLAARELDLELEQVEVDHALLGEHIASVAIANDALPAWEQEIAQHHLARAAARSHKAVLVGDAADETHFGYHFLLDDVATASPGAILGRLGAAPIRADVLPDPVAHFDAFYKDMLARSGARWETRDDRVRATTALVVSRWLPRLLHNGDAHTMRFSLEGRVPFADTRLLAAAARVPPRLALAGGIEKSVLREASRGLVSEAIRTRKKSALPKDQRASAIYQREASTMLDRESAFLGRWLDLARVRELATRPGELLETERATLFRVIALGHWAEHHGVARA
ncbi:MAG: asparagine synthase [Myxococcaceae bacterium]|nr:asparagine synthase [Myxococcaceae bacterium]